MRFGGTIRPAMVSFALLCGGLVCAGQSQPAASEPVVVDRVVAVVNDRAILGSDIEDEMRVEVLEPRPAGETPDRSSALARLISRVLIQQQVRREEEQAAVPSDEQVQARIQGLRHQLPACVRANCATDEGWAAFLSANHLTEEQVVRYFRLRLEILSFIESRFRQGIRVSQEEIETYYQKTLLPQYPAGQPAPPLDNVSQRIEEILLQQKVNNMFGEWLENLRKQGDVEILDPTLEMPGNPQSGGGGDA